jgi:2-oxoisovalerate dehydrogenase E1 component
VTQAGQDPKSNLGISHDELRLAYRVAAASRAMEEHLVRLVNKGEVKFAIWGPGEEIHGTATALALSRVTSPERFGIVPHYRSGCLCSMWCSLNGVDDFAMRVLRQQFSRGTDAMSGGRQMVYHLHLPEVGILPVQSPVGMQLGKAAGYALGHRLAGLTDGIAMAIIGDGTSAEGDLHDAMNAASVWDLPVIYVVTDNRVAISTLPEEGRGIRDFKAYAESFGLKHFAADGRDFFDVYRATLEAATWARDQQKPAFMHIHDLPRFNGHSSAADVTFDLSQADPLIAFGQHLVEIGALSADDVLVRVPGQGRDFFAHHRLGAVMAEEEEKVRALLDAVRAEPEPDPAHLFNHVYAPFPSQPETAPGPGETVITYAGALRSAIDKLIQRKGAYIAGEDVGRLGGVMTATAGLKRKHPERVIDAPLNEPLIVGTGMGAGLHDGVMALPEVQFGDYALNAFHWLVHLGNLHWTTNGTAKAKVVVRMPTDPFGGGAVYHSMSVDGYFGSIPGLVVIMPSTSFDAHGLLLSAGDYDGPVVMLEPKWMYRQSLGPAFPGEPSDPTGVAELRKSIMRGEIPELPDVYVPFGKGVIRRPGTDVTVVAWGRAVWTAMAAAKAAQEQGISLEIIDLRTLVPPDMELVLDSVRRTGRLVVAAENRPFGGFVREIQGQVTEALPGTPTKSVGQENLPGISQSALLEENQALDAGDIVDAAREMMGVSLRGRATHSFVAPRWLIG